MTGGRVSPARLPLAPLEIRDGNGNWQALTFVLDTGFTGFIAIPESYVRQLVLTLDETDTAASATEQSVTLRSGYARIIRFGQQRTVRVVQTGTHPLIGMSLLWNHHIAIDAVPDGAVAITPYGG